MGRRIALLIATDGYADPGLNQLRAPGREADQLARLLEDPAVGRFDRVRVLANRPKAEVEEAIEELLTNRQPDDLVLLYFACHGLANDADRLFFATVDTQLSRRNTTAVRASFVHDLLDECEAAAKIVLLDCCFSGLFSRDLAPRAERRVEVEREVVGKGTFVLTSTTSLAYAYEGTRFTDNGEPASVFTGAVIEGLRSGAADADRDGVITPDELYGYVFDAVVAQLGEEQKPTKKGSYTGRVELAYATAARHGRRGGPVPGPHGLILGELLPSPIATLDQGLRCEGWDGASRFEVPVGRIEHRGGAETVTADLAGRGSHAAVVGRTGSGKTTLLRTLLLGTALTHTPDEAAFFLLEGGVNGLGVLHGLPHVRQIAAPHESEAVAAVLAEVQALVDSRQRLFRELNLESADDFRSRRVSGGLPPGRHADVFLVLDGWLDFALTRPGLPHEIQRIANAGLYCGVHVLVSARQWGTLPAELLSVLDTRYELALDEPDSSRYDPVLSATLSTGRALVDGRPFRVAAPRMEPAGGEWSGERAALAALADAVSAAWRGVEPFQVPPPADPLTAEVLLTELLGIDDPETFDPVAAWRDREPADLLRVPIGVDAAGRPVLLDLKEGGRGGMGPHGLCVGATGSGKTELLRDVVLALALTHSPREVAFALVDYKGGAAFAGLGLLPHTSALITGLAGDLNLVDRMTAALLGEVARRQGILAGSASADGDDEETARGLPTLLVVIDEFNELVTAQPAVLDLLQTISRVGRGLGIHLLLSAQRLDDERLGGVADELGYRIALRTYSPTGSRAVIDIPDAQRLPGNLPGSGYLQPSGAQQPTRFRGARVSQPYVPAHYGGSALPPDALSERPGLPEDPAPTPEAGGGARLPAEPAPAALPAERALAAEPAPAALPETPDGPPGGTGRPRTPGLPGHGGAASPRRSPLDAGVSVYDVLAAGLVGTAPSAHRIWQPPLGESVPLDALFGPTAAFGVPRHTARIDRTRFGGRLRVPIGVVDRPARHRSEPLVADLSSGGGHLAVVGGPQSGKTNLVRTLLCALALTHSPAEVRFLCLAFGGGGLARLAALPHTSGLAGRLDEERVHAVVNAAGRILAEREARLTAAGADAAAARGSGGAAPAPPPDGDVVVVVDGWEAVRQDYESLEPKLVALAQRGSAHGIHLVVTANRWTPIPRALRDLPLIRHELRLGDPYDSELGHTAAAKVPAFTPGRGLTAEGAHFRAALPRIDGGTGTDDLGTAVSFLVDQVCERWPGPAAPRIRPLPSRVPLSAVAEQAPPRRDFIPLGVTDGDLPVGWDFTEEPHLLIYGERGSGKSNALRVIARGIAAAHSPERAVLYLVDFRRSLLGAVPGPHLLMPSAGALIAHMTEIRDALAERRVRSDLTAEQLRDGSRWNGPDVYVLVDDYELVAGDGADPLAPLLELLHLGRDIGLHLVLARSSRGAARARFEPLLSKLHQLDTGGIVLSGDPAAEGPLIGRVRPSRQRPGRGSLADRSGDVRTVQLALDAGSVAPGEPTSGTAVPVPPPFSSPSPSPTPTPAPEPGEE